MNTSDSYTKFQKRIYQFKAGRRTPKSQSEKGYHNVAMPNPNW